MLSKAGTETGEKDLWVTEDKNGRISRRVVRVAAAKNPPRRTEEASYGQSG